MTLSPASRSLRARIGAYALHAKHDARETTSAARSTFLARFETVVDPDRRLDPEERRRRAAFARREHFARMALRSAMARRLKTKNGAPTKGRRSDGAGNAHRPRTPTR